MPSAARPPVSLLFLPSVLPSPPPSLLLLLLKLNISLVQSVTTAPASIRPPASSFSFSYLGCRRLPNRPPASPPLVSSAHAGCLGGQPKTDRQRERERGEGGGGGGSTSILPRSLSLSLSLSRWCARQFPFLLSGSTRVVVCLRPLPRRRSTAVAASLTLCASAFFRPSVRVRPLADGMRARSVPGRPDRRQPPVVRSFFRPPIAPAAVGPLGWIVGRSVGRSSALTH